MFVCVVIIVGKMDFKISVILKSDSNLCFALCTDRSFFRFFSISIKIYVSNIVFAVKSESGVNAPSEGWTAKAGDGFKGKATISSLQLSAQNGEYASYTCSLTGVGALEHVV